MLELRDYQKECLDSNVEALTRSNSLLNVLPMSAGKTIIFCYLANTWVNTEGSKVLILSDRDKITKQNLEKMKELFPERRVGLLQGRNFPEIGTEVICSTIQSCKNHEKLNLVVGKIGLIIIDESHKSLCKSYDELKELLPEAKYTHFTATPYKDNQLVTKMYDEVVYSMSIQQLISGGYCVKPKLIALPNQDSEKVKTAVIIKTYKEFENDKQAAVFMRTVDQCFDARAAFVSAGIAAEVIVGKTTEKTREDVFDKFEKGEIKVIITCNVISEGFDCPPLEVIFLPYKSSSVSLYIQRVGRALRQYPGKENARIYASGRIPSIQKAFYQALVEGEKKKRTVRDDLEIMELFDDGMTSNSLMYTWTKDVVDIANLLKSMNKLNLEKLLVEKKFPTRLLKNLDLIKLGIEDGTFSDSLTSFESAVTRQGLKNMASGKSKWMVATGRFQGYHIKDVPYLYRKAHRAKCSRAKCPVCDQMRKWFYLNQRN